MKSYVGVNKLSSAGDKLFACPADTFYYEISNGVYVASSSHRQAAFDFSSYWFNAGAMTIFGTNTPGLAGRKLTSIRNPARTVLIAEMPAFVPFSWHDPKKASHLSGALANDAKNMVSFVDGHVRYIKIYFTTNTPKGSELALFYDPPAGYEYQWSAD